MRDLRDMIWDYIKGWVQCCQAVLLVLLLVTPVAAHELDPGVADVTFAPDGRSLSLRIVMNLEAALAGIPPEHDDTDESVEAAIYDGYRALPPADIAARFAQFESAFLDMLRIEADGAPQAATRRALDIPEVGDLEEPRYSAITVSATLPDGTNAVSLGWDRSLGPLVVRTTETEGYFSAFLTDGAMSDPIALAGRVEQGFGAVLLSYIGHGFRHILPSALDHILFAAGLFLLSARLRPILWQVTAFTLAHTVTLGLTAAGWLSVPPSIVEPLIAASIVYIGVENILSPTMTRWRPLVIFAFGLLHGMGFAGGLRDFGLPEGQFLAALLGFNIGVELGQLAVILLLASCLGFWFGSKPYYRRFVVIPGSLLIAGFGLWWLILRVLA